MYTIRREELFEKEFSEIGKNFNRIHEFEAAIDWFLCRPDKILDFVTQLSGFENHFLWRTKDININFPQIIILYKVDYTAELVTLISVQQIRD